MARDAASFFTRHHSAEIRPGPSGRDNREHVLPPLRPTLALDTPMASVCAQAFGIDLERAAPVLFPQGAAGRRLEGGAAGLSVDHCGRGKRLRCSWTMR